jgi:hypothetical protein
MKRILLVVTLMVLISSFAFSSPLITFHTPASQKITSGGGQIAYTGGSTPLVGSNILISSISAGSNTITCTGCVLNFTTGNFMNQTTVNNIRTWNFNGGAQQLGQFTITGQAAAAGITTTTTLLSGYFTAPTLSLTGVIGSTPRYRFFSGSLFDVKNPTLVDYLLGAGYSATYGNYFTGNYTQDFADNLTNNRQIPILSDTLLNGSVDNNQVVPEPSSVILFGSVGLALALACFLRRRKVSAVAD